MSVSAYLGQVSSAVLTSLLLGAHDGRHILLLLGKLGAGHVVLRFLWWVSEGCSRVAMCAGLGYLRGCRLLGLFAGLIALVATGHSGISEGNCRRLVYCVGFFDRSCWLSGRVRGVGVR